MILGLSNVQYFLNFFKSKLIFSNLNLHQQAFKWAAAPPNPNTVHSITINSIKIFQIYAFRCNLQVMTLINCFAYFLEDKISIVNWRNSRDYAWPFTIQYFNTNTQIDETKIQCSSEANGNTIILRTENVQKKFKKC